MSSFKEVNQKTRVLDYMQENNGITSWEAIKEFGVTRLSAVIYDLRKEGYGIVGVYENSTNRYGEPVKFKRYHLVSEYFASKKDKEDKKGFFSLIKKFF